MKPYTIITIIILLCVISSHERVIKRKITLGQLKSQKILFITHFDFGIGESNITLKYRKQGVQNTQISNLKVGLLLDQQYQDYKKAKTCRQKQQVYNQVQRIRFYDSLTGAQYIRVNQSVREHLWFVYIFNCDQFDLKTQDGSQGIIFEITLYNNGSHFGEDEGMFWPYLILFIIWVAILVTKLFMPMLKSALRVRSDPVQLLLSSGYLIIGLSLFYKLINIITEGFSGQKIVFFDILHGILKNLAQGFMLTLLIAIAWGWSIVNPKMSTKVMLIAIAVTISNVVNVVLWHNSEQAEDSYHQYEQLPGVIVFLIRLGLAFAFVFGCIHTSTKLIDKKKQFMGRFGKLGTLYMFSWPLAVVICQLFLPQYLHNEVVTISQQYIHLITNAYICWIFAHNDSQYKKVNLKKDDQILPDYVQQQKRLRQR